MLPSLTRRTLSSPFETLAEMRREMDRLFNGLPMTFDGTWVLPADVVETDDAFQFHIDVPGLKPEELDVTVENNVLTISGERKWERDEKKNGDYLISERRYGRFQRSFALPRRVDAERIEARYDNGVVTITLPKLEEAKPRRIQIKAAAAGREIGAGV